MESINAAFHSNDVIAAMLFCFSAGFGQLLHGFKKWLEGDEGWMSTNIKRTLAAVIGNIGGMLVFVQSGVLGPLLALPNGMFAIFLFGFMNGFAADSGLNKAKVP